MLNQVVLVGRLTSNPEVREVGEGKKVCDITIAVPRSFKNADGQYDTDFIPLTLWDNIATNTAGYCNKGDIVGAKGRVQSKDGHIEIVAEKITFLSSKKADE
jgi:single-strand DNA-binding protein